MALTTIPASLSATALTLTTAAQPNITSVGTLTGLTVSGNIAGTLTTAAQTNITSVGTLTGLVVNGNASIQTGALTLSGANPPLSISNSGDAKVNFVRSSNTISYALSSAASGGHGFYDNAASAYDLYMKAGKVGIGTTNPADALHILDTSGHAYASVARSTQSQGEVGLRLRGGTSGNDWYIYQKPSNNNLNFYNTSDRMTIDSSGNVGIGTTAPGTKLHVTGTTTFDGDGASRAEITSSTANSVVSLDVGGFTGTPSVARDVRFLTNVAANNKSERMRITSAGNVGIGTTNPSGPLNVHSASGDTNLYVTTGNTAASTNIFFGDSGNSTIGRIVYDHNGDYMKFRTNGSDAMRITSGGVGIGTSSSPSFAAGGGLQVQADTFSSVRVTETGNTGLDVSQASDAKGYIYLRDNADLIFGTNNTERMRILASGNVGVDRGQKIQWYDGTIGSGNINAAIEGTGDPALKLFTRQSGTSTLTERMRIDANGHLILKKNLVLESTSEGIDFSGVGSSAETLDDYEEGTWTGRLASSTSGGTNYDSAGATGRYIKIGRLVHIQIHYTQSISGSGGGAVYMIGLPYAAQNYNSMTHWVYGGFDNLPANFSPILRTQIGQSAIIFQAQKGGASSIDISPSNFGGGVNIMVSGTYVTAS